MGRPKKIEDSRSRSFLLPRELLEEIESSAEMRGKDASDVVRELLEASIPPYRRESERIWRQRMRDAIIAAQRDPAVCALFTKYKGKKELVMPLDAGLSHKQQLILMEALRAERKQRTLPDEEYPVNPLLEEMANGLDQPLKDHVLGLQILLDDGNVGINGDKECGIFVTVDEAIDRMIKHREFDACPAIEDLDALIKRKMLRAKGTLFYQWVPRR